MRRQGRELLIDAIEFRTQALPVLRGELRGRAEQASNRTDPDGLALQPQLLVQLPGNELACEHSDGPCQGGGIGDDLIAGHRDVVPT